MINKLLIDSGFEIRSTLNYGKGEQRVYCDMLSKFWYHRIAGKPETTVRVESVEHFKQLDKANS